MIDIIFRNYNSLADSLWLIIQRREGVSEWGADYDEIFFFIFILLTNENNANACLLLKGYGFSLGCNYTEQSLLAESSAKVCWLRLLVRKMFY